METLRQKTLTYLLEVHIVGKLHVLCVDAKDLETTRGIRNANVNLSIESTKSTKSRVDRVRTVRSRHHDNVRTGLEAVHERKELRHDTTLDFAVCLQNRGNQYV